MKTTLNSNVAALLASLVLTGGVLAQNGGAPAGTAPAQPAGGQPATAITPPAEAEAPAPRVPPPSPTWTDADLGKIGDMLVGSWKTTAPVAQAGADAGASTDVVMNIAHVTLSELPNTLYVESARADALHAPYRQAVFQLYKSKGKVRLRTLEFAGYGVDKGAFVGLWLIPNYFADVPRSNFIATMDLELTTQGATVVGKSPHPYPTDRGGAVEMTSEMTIGAGTLKVADRGFDAEGKIAWGSGEKDAYTFAKFKAPVTVDARPNGLFIMDFKKPSEGQAVAANDRVSVQYSGWLPGGYQFDSTKKRGQPYTYSQGGMIAGWNEGVIGATMGTVRRLYVPWELGFGEKGNARAGIPGKSDVIFEIEVLHVETPAPPPQPSAAPEGANPGANPGAGAPPAADAGKRKLPPFVVDPRDKKPAADPAKPAESPK